MRRAKQTRQIGDTVISRIGHEEDFGGLVSASIYLGAELSDSGLNLEAIAQTDREVLLSLIHDRREVLRTIMSTESGLIDILSELEEGHRNHAQSISEYQHYLDPLVLWIPSSASLWKANFSRMPQEVPP